MKRSYTYLKGLLTLALAALTGGLWAAEVYKNSLAGDVSYVFNGKNYNATKFTALTALTENDELGNFDKVIYKVGSDNDTQTHTFAMWVMLESLSNDQISNDQILWWVHGGHNGEHSGYAVKAMGDGGIRVGKTNANGAWNGGNYYTSPTKGLVKANTWTHVALAVTKTADARTATSTLYVNGVKIQDFAGFPTNLNGGGGSATVASVGANVTAANVYVDDTVLDADAIRKLYVTSHEAYSAAWTWDGTGGTATADALPSGATVYTVNNYTTTVENVPAKNFTFSFWTKRDGASDWRDIAGFANANNAIGLEKGRSDALWFYGAAQGKGPDGADVGFVLSNDTLQMVTLVVNNGVITTYVNGTQIAYVCEKSEALVQGSNPTTLTVANWTDLTSDEAMMTRFGLGCRPLADGSERTTNATIADARVYASALSADEIRWAYLDAITSKATIVEVTAEGVGPHNLSTLTTSGAGAIVKVTLEDGATLNIDTAINWNKLIVASEGDATVVAGATATLATLATEGEGLISFTASGDNKISATKVKAEANTAFAPGVISPVAPIAVGDGKVLTVASPTEYASVTGGTLRYAGGDAIEKLDFSAVTSVNGTTIVAKTVNEVTTVSEMGNERADGYLSINKNRTLIVEEDGVINVGTRLAMNDIGGGSATLTIDGGTINVKGEGVNFGATNGAAVLFGHWGSSPVVNINRGTLDASKGGVMPGWDGSSTLTVGTELSTTNTVGSAVLKAKGMGGKGAVTIKPSGKIEIGSLGITTDVGRGGMTMALAGGELAIIDDASLNFASETSFTITADSTISVASGKTATLNTLLSGTGTLTVTGGGKLIIPHAVAANVKMNVVEGTTLELTPSAEDVITGKLTLAEGTTISGTLNLIGIDEFETNGSSVTFEANAAITGSAWWWDYEFNGGATSIGSDTGTMTLEGNATSYTTADANGNQELYFQKTPYRGASFTSQNAFTAVMYCQPGAYNNVPLIGFGSTTANDKVTVVLATGANAANGEMQILLIRPNATNPAFDVIPLADNLIVPNATTAKHLYAFTYDVQADKTVISVYVDGKLKKVTTINEQLHVSNGFQIGSLHGGVAPEVEGLVWDTGLTKYPASGDAGTLDFLRVAKGVLSVETMTALAKAYPYVSEKGIAQRTIADATATWVADAAWTQKVPNAADATQTMPNDGTNVELTATADTQVTVNLNADVSYESLAIAGSDVTFVAGDAAKKIVAGDVTIDADVTISYGVAEIGTLTVKAGKTLTFDFSAYNFASVWADRTISLTGLATVADGAEVTATIPETLPAQIQSATLAYNGETQEYALVIDVVEGELTGTIAADGNWDSITWKMGEADVTPTDFTAMAAVNLIASADATLSMNKAVTVKNLVISGEGALIIAENGGNKLTVSGATTINANVTATAGAAALGTITINEGKALAIKETIANVGTIASNAGELVYMGGNITEGAQLQATYGAIRIATGTVTMTNDNGFYTGTITIDNGATLASGTTNSIPFTKGTIVNNGTLQISHGVLPPVSGLGNIVVAGGCDIGGVITTTGTLTVNEGATATLWHHAEDFVGIAPAINGPSVVIANGASIVLGEGYTSKNSHVTIPAGKSISGTGTISTILEMTNGSTLDASAGALTANEVWMMDASKEGFVTKLTLPEGYAADTPIINCATKTTEVAADLTKIAPAGYKCVADGNTIKLAVAGAFIVGEGVYETFAAAFTAAIEGEVAEITIDKTATETVFETPGFKITKSVTIDLGGKTLRLTPPAVGSAGTETLGIQILNTAEKVVIKNGKIDVAASNLTAEKPIKMMINNYTNLKLENVTLDGSNLYKEEGKANYTLSNNSGEVTIDATSKIIANDGGIAFDVCKYSTYTPPTVTVAEGAEITGKVEITGGELTAPESLKTQVVTIDGYKVVYEGGKYTAVAKGAFEVNGVDYATLAEAYAAGDAITLTADATSAGIKITKDVTLDLGGYTLTLTPPAVGSAGTETLGIQILKGTTVAINNGKIDVVASNSTAEKPIKMMINNYSTALTLTGVILDGTNLVKPANSPIYVLSNNSGTVTIGAGSAIIAPAGGIAFDVCKYASYTAPEVTVEDGAEITGKVEITGGSLVAPETLAAQMITSAGNKVVLQDGKYVMVAIVYVAQVGGDKYETLQAAVNAATDGATVTLVNDVELTAFVEITKSIILELNGKKINRADGTALYVNTDGVIVTIQGAGSVSGNQAVYVNAGTVTIKGGNFHGYNGGHAVYVQGTGKAEIFEGTFSSDAGKYHYVLNKYDADRATTSIVVKGGKFLGFNPANNGAEGEGTNFCAVGYTAVAAGDVYTVTAIVIDDKLDNTPAADAIKAAMQAVGVTEIESYTITTKGADATADADAVAAVLEVFDVTPTVDANGELTVKYEFGIAAMTNVGDTVTITAGVTGAEYRAGVAVVFYADGAKLGAALSRDGKTVSITADAKDINGKKITVEASNEVRFE